jgi:hypothetical protein
VGVRGTDRGPSSSRVIGDTSQVKAREQHCSILYSTVQTCT